MIKARQEGKRPPMGTFKAGALALMATALLSTAAEAKLMRYIIDGKTYSYSTNNDAQTQEAKKRMHAAKRSGSEVKVAHSFKEWKHLQHTARKPREKVETARRAPRQMPDVKVTASVSKAAPRLPAAIPELTVLRTPAATGIRSVTFDLRSGIKTIRHDDGSVHEQPFEASELERLSPPARNSFIDHGRNSEPVMEPDLNSFVDQVRRPEFR